MLVHKGSGTAWMMMNRYSGMVDHQKAFRFIFSQDHCESYSTSQISDTSQATF